MALTPYHHNMRSLCTFFTFYIPLLQLTYICFTNMCHCLYTIIMFRWKCRNHDDVMKWKHVPRYWYFVRRVHRSSVNSPHRGQWRGALMFYLILALNKRLRKQSRRWWFETLSRPLWRHCNDTPGLFVHHIIPRSLSGVAYKLLCMHT